MKLRLPAAHRGRLFALGSAAAFAIIPPLGRLSYDDGASPGMVILARLLFGAVGAALAVWLLRRRWSIPRRDWLGTGIVCVAWIVVNVGYMASYFYIPVSLAVLIFFTFPVLIALVGPLVAGQRPEPVTLSAAVLAFIGLVLALGPDIGGLDWRGCALAFAAALGAATTFLVSQRLIVEQDLFAFSFHLHAVCFGTVLLGYALFGLPDVPVSMAGWVPLAGIAIFYVTAVLLQFGAIRFAGPARASVIFNIEPVLTMLGAALILSELLGAWQFGGAALVVAAVLLSTRARQPV